MMSFQIGFMSELAKLAAEDADAQKKSPIATDSFEYRPSTKRGAIANVLKHILYSGAGGVGAGLAANFVAGGKYAPAAADAGRVLGLAFSLSRNKDRMKRRLMKQHLDASAIQKLRSDGALSRKWTDFVPVYGAIKATKDIRQSLSNAGKQTRGHTGEGIFTQPSNNADG